MLLDPLEEIIRNGNRGMTPEGEHRMGPNWLVCKDGFFVSVIAGFGTYCIPRERNYADPDFQFTNLELGYPSVSPAAWSEYEDGSGVYARVPADLVREVISAHGGVVAISFAPPNT